MKRYQGVLIGFFLCFLCTAGTAAGSALEVFVSIPPLKYLTDQVGESWVKTHVLVASGQDPHTFAPRPAQVRLLARARIYFTVGLAFEHSLVDRFHHSLPGLHIVDLAAVLPHRQTLSGHHASGQDQHEDPHIWLDPQKLKKMARVVASALSEIDPAHAMQYQANLQRVEARLEKVYTTIKAQLAPYAGSAIYVFHPAFGHFASAFGLRQEAVESQGKSPTPRQLARLIARALAVEADMLILDEPTASIDSRSEAHFFALLKELNSRMTILMVTHEVGFASTLFSRIVCVNNRVVLHPTSELTGQLIRDMYGADMRMIRHDHCCGAEGHRYG